MKNTKRILTAALTAALVFSGGCAEQKVLVAEEWASAQEYREPELPGEGVGRALRELKPEEPGEGIGRVKPRQSVADEPETETETETEPGTEPDEQLSAEDESAEETAAAPAPETQSSAEGGEGAGSAPEWQPSAPAEPAYEIVPESEPEPQYAAEDDTFYPWRSEVICIDPGHGFIDGGAGPGLFSLGTVEKDITIVVARFLKEELEERGFQAVLTHNGLSMPEYGDTNGDGIFSAPYERPGYINDYIDPDYLVSLHVNAVADYADACGIIVYYSQSWRKVNEWSRGAAQSIVNAIEASELEKTAPPRLTNDQETADASFAINRETRAASSLIEMGFCTNPTDANLLQDPAWQRPLAEAIAIGIEAFFDSLA